MKQKVRQLMKEREPELIVAEVAVTHKKHRFSWRYEFDGSTGPTSAWPAQHYKSDATALAKLLQLRQVLPGILNACEFPELRQQFLKSTRAPGSAVHPVGFDLPSPNPHGERPGSRINGTRGFLFYRSRQLLNIFTAAFWIIFPEELDYFCYCFFMGMHWLNERACSHFVQWKFCKQLFLELPLSERCSVESFSLNPKCPCQTHGPGKKRRKLGIYRKLPLKQHLRFVLAEMSLD
jgi:hypothetical protein